MLILVVLCGGKNNMVKLYKSDRGIVHMIKDDHICNQAIGAISEHYPSGIFEGRIELVTCQNCLGKFNL